MSRQSLATLLAAVVTVVFVCLAGTGLLLGGSAAGCGSGATPGRSLAPAPTGGWPAVGRWDRNQVANAAVIAAVGASKGVPTRGWVIAVATAMQESTLRNLPGGDRDSVGLFQQRPSQGWGTVAQLLDPAYAAGRFYAKLMTIPGWQTMALTEAAQRVQVSAYPDAYAKWEPEATQLVGTITSGGSSLPTGRLASCGGASGPWTQPVLAAVGSGFRTAGRPGHDGVDLSAARGTVIRAASAGIVSRVRCNAIDNRDGSNWGCDRDGDPGLTSGCGWYVDIDHDGGIITRYCHMNEPPQVDVGDHVVVGQPIGVVGSTGHSSGPHLHFEVHANGDASAEAAIDPVLFMINLGAPLG
ncbi:M23 family metallopeptidase [Micromonospora sp. WMMD736]|uniref:M23 family metallopeptidase n=1 Tax=Micromonospora sp. WMMD736 TaxID=3404112 RepID=UPI003B9456EF